MDRARLDWLHYRQEAVLNAMLDDDERTEQIRDLFEAYLAFQSGKTPEQIAREERADWILNQPRLNPRYRALLEEANRAAREADGPQDDR